LNRLWGPGLHNRRLEIAWNRCDFRLLFSFRVRNVSSTDVRLGQPTPHTLGTHAPLPVRMRGLRPRCPLPVFFAWRASNPHWPGNNRALITNRCCLCSLSDGTHRTSPASLPLPHTARCNICRLAPQCNCRADGRTFLLLRNSRSWRLFLFSKFRKCHRGSHPLDGSPTVRVSITLSP
jgi:hypothetical protein